MTRAEEEFERWRRQQRRWKRFRARLRKAKLRRADDYEVERVAALSVTSAVPPKADIAERRWDVRFVPIADIGAMPQRCSPCAHRLRHQVAQ